MIRVKTFNLVAAVVTATALALGAFQLALPDAGDPSGWWIAGAWILAAIVWAIVFSLVREGIRPTVSALRRR